MLKTMGAAGALALLLFSLAPAQAGALVTGVIRDRAGVAVVGAEIRALDGDGRVVSRDDAGADGTFALDLPPAAVAVAITCAYCEPVRRRIDPAGEPLIVIVERFAAVTQAGPSAADIRALPFRSAADIASLQPFTVVAGGRISDRGLDVSGVTLINGLPLYSPVDADDYSELVPAHAIAALDSSSPLAAPVYGGYASAGVYDLRFRDPDLATSRLDAGDGRDLVARVTAPSVDAMYADSNDGGVRRSAIAGDADLAFAGGRVSIDALAVADPAARASGAALAYATDSRRYATAVAVRASQSDDSSLVSFDASVRNRGPLGLQFGVRGARSTSDGSGSAVAAAQADGAVYADATRRSGAVTTAASVAFDRGSDSGAGANVRAAALVAALGSDVRLSGQWSVHSGIVSNLRIPAFAETTFAADEPAIPGDRSLLFEQSLSYTDLRRVRITGIGYTQRATGALTSHVNGIGIDAGWQIAPQLSLRTWLLRANQSALSSAPLPPLYLAPPTSAAPLTRQLVWLTYDCGLRIDALVRGGSLEGDIRIPLAATYALAIGTATYEKRRVTTIGLTVR